MHAQGIRRGWAILATHLPSSPVQFLQLLLLLLKAVLVLRMTSAVTASLSHTAGDV
jgi:hypothetical protein